MSLLNPILLYALGFLAVPLLILFFVNRRQVVLRWAAWEWMRRAVVTKRRRIRVTEWLKLIAKLLLVAALVLFVARPASRVRGSGRALLVIDQTLSMAARMDNGTRLDRARDLAVRFLRGTEQAVAVYAFDGRFSRLSKLRERPAAVSSLLAGLEVVPRAATVRQFAGGLAGLPELKDVDTVFFLSDFQQAQYRDPKALVELLDRTGRGRNLVFVPVDPRSNLENCSIEGARFLPEGCHPGRANRLAVRVRNRSPLPAADLLLYDRPEAVETRDGRAVTNAPVAVVPMARAADGVWEAAREGLDVGRHYAFRVDGPAGAGEGFDAGAPVGDPYALAAAHAHGLPLVIDPAATNAWFPGGPPDGFRAPAATDLVIYEAHVRDLTSDPSSGVAPALRGTYPGLTASAGTGAALDHLAALGVNAIQFLPVAEFGNGTNDHGWGYNTVYFFAPEASYGTDPLRGSAYHEFKQLVRELHRRGFAVILDVVYNHVGEPNLFHRIDRPYYFRLDPDLGYRNASGCGNEFRSEAPMARRLIVDNVRYWMREHGVDGFRFDLAELIDLETLMAVRDAARELNPNVILISEPWSLRGDHKRALRGTGWAAWNNEFRDPAKHFALGRGDRDRLVKAVAGSVATWTAEPRQSVNYLESHDDSALADELSGRPDRDGRVPTEEAAARNRLAATLLFTSLGIPMIGEGQEFLRSKGGRHNTFAGGDAVNALRWADRQQPLAAEALAYYAGLIRLRRSPAGASLRLGDAPPPGYVEWILPPGETALGYAINGRRERPGAAFVVLANAGDAPFAFDVNWPPGAWRQVGDGRRIRPEGLDPDRGSAAPQRDRDGGGSPGRDRAPTGTEGGRPDGTGLPPPPFGLRRASPPPPFGLRRASPPSPFGPRWASPRVAEQGGRVVVPPRSAWVFMAD